MGKKNRKKNMQKGMDVISPYFSAKDRAEIKELMVDNKKLLAETKELRKGRVNAEFGELTKGGFDWQQNTMANQLGDFNPDTIPISTYDKMRWDGQLRLGLMTVKLPIMSRNFWIKCEDKDIRAFVDQNIREVWRSLVKSMLTGLDYGFATHEKVWEAAQDYRVVDDKNNIDYVKDMIKYKKFKSLHPNTITVKYDEKMNYMGFWQNKDRTNEVFIKPRKSFIFTNDMEWGNIYGWSRLKAAYPYWYTYWIVDAWHERWLQKRGIPPVIVTYPQGQSEIGSAGGTPQYKDNADIARDAGKSFQPDTVVTLPSDVTETPNGVKSNWDMKTFEDNSRIDAYVAAKEALDIRKLRAILIPERAITQDASTGSLRAAESQAWILTESLKGLIADMADHLNKFAIPNLVKNNWGDKAPKATIEIEEVGKELTSALFEIYLQMIATGRANPGIKKMEEILNVPVETEEEKKERIEAQASLGITNVPMQQQVKGPQVPGGGQQQISRFGKIPGNREIGNTNQRNRRAALSERIIWEGI